MLSNIFSGNLDSWTELRNKNLNISLRVVRDSLVNQVWKSRKCAELRQYRAKLAMSRYDAFFRSFFINFFLLSCKQWEKCYSDVLVSHQQGLWALTVMKSGLESLSTLFYLFGCQIHLDSSWVSFLVKSVFKLLSGHVLLRQKCVR